MIESHSPEAQKRRRLSGAAAAVLSTLALANCGGEVREVVTTVTVTVSPTTPEPTGPCPPFRVYAQNTDVRAYPENPGVWGEKSDIWFHTLEGDWVPFAAVREKPTVFDPTSRSKYGGEPAYLDPACEM